jgi:hypothetical protein
MCNLSLPIAEILYAPPRINTLFVVQRQFPHLPVPELTALVQQTMTEKVKKLTSFLCDGRTNQSAELSSPPLYAADAQLYVSA